MGSGAVLLLPLILSAQLVEAEHLMLKRLESRLVTCLKLVKKLKESVLEFIVLPRIHTIRIGYAYDLVKIFNDLSVISLFDGILQGVPCCPPRVSPSLS